MKRMHPISTVALVLALLALGASIGGGAYAAAKIGKNQVVAKSIKDGAVTAPKIKPGAVTGATVQDGSLSAADLAPGTVPVQSPGTSVMFASVRDYTSTPNSEFGMSAIGPYDSGADEFAAVAPVTIEVSQLHVVTVAQTPSQSVQVAIETGTDVGGTGGVAVLSCTVTGASDRCANAGSATIPAGNVFFVHLLSGPGGSNGSLLTLSYTVRVP